MVTREEWRRTMCRMDRLHAWRDRTRLAYVGAVMLLAVIGWRVLPSMSSPSPSHASAARPAVEVRTTPVAPTAAVLVHVVGAVRHPGVYRLDEGARLQDAVRKAGGPRRNADLAALNLAAPASDGQQVVVPTRARGGTAAVAPAAAGSGVTGTAPVSLSRATAAELEALDGIGPALAQRIIDWRDANGGFGSVDDLLEVPGIGEARLETLRAAVTP